MQKSIFAAARPHLYAPFMGFVSDIMFYLNRLINAITTSSTLCVFVGQFAEVVLQTG